MFWSFSGDSKKKFKNPMSTCEGRKTSAVRKKISQELFQ
jgi:hypothetical protein